MKVRAGRKAGGADIADYLAAPDARTGGHRDTAHMTIAGAEAAAMIEPDITAMAAMPAGVVHYPVGHRINRRTIGGGEIDAGVHSGIAQDRVIPHAIARRHASGDRHA